MGLYSNDRPACLANQYWTKVGVNGGGGKHYNLLQYGNNYCRKKFYSTGPKERPDIQHKGLSCDTQHNKSATMLSVAIYLLC
jgi:hypothetical protein